MLIAAMTACAAIPFAADASAWALSQGDLAAASGATGTVKAEAAGDVSSASAPVKPGPEQLKAFKKASADFSAELSRRRVAAEGANGNVTIARDIIV